MRFGAGKGTHVFVRSATAPSAATLTRQADRLLRDDHATEAELLGQALAAAATEGEALASVPELWRCAIPAGQPPPGRYTLRADLVYARVRWFERDPARRASLDVGVASEPRQDIGEGKAR